MRPSAALNNRWPQGNRAKRFHSFSSVAAMSALPETREFGA
jgi:hypothetical protein